MFLNGREGTLRSRQPFQISFWKKNRISVCLPVFFLKFQCMRLRSNDLVFIMAEAHTSFSTIQKHEKNFKKPLKQFCDRPTNQPTNRPTDRPTKKWLIELHSSGLKNCLSVCLLFFESADARDLGLMTLFLSWLKPIHAWTWPTFMYWFGGANTDLLM